MDICPFSRFNFEMESRYYNPEWGRFLNANALFIAGSSLTGANMFAYCLNNPVMHSDPSGYVTVADKFIVAYLFELIGIIINNESGADDSGYLSSALNADLDSSYISSSSIDDYGLHSYTVHLGGFDFDAVYYRIIFESGNYDAWDKKVAHTENSLATKIFSNGLFKLFSGIVGEISPTKGKWVVALVGFLLEGFSSTASADF